MTATAEQVLEVACTLTADDRSLLIDALIATLPTPASDLTNPEWLDNIRRRSREVLAGQVTPIPWSEVQARAGRMDWLCS